MTYTDAKHVPDHPDNTEREVWHLYLAEDKDEYEIPELDMESFRVTSACGQHGRNEDALITVKEHANEEWEEIFTPTCLTAYIQQGAVCDECAEAVAERLNLQVTVRS